MDPITTAELTSSGHSRRDIARLCESGHLVRIARGVYLRGATDRTTRHLALASSRTHALALESAALAHGLPVISTPEQVHTVLAGSGRSRGRPRELQLSGPLPPRHLVTLGSQLVTSRARTVVDLTRLRGLEQGLVTWDAARWTARIEGRLETFDAEVADVIAVMCRRKGIGRARQAQGLSSAYSQSPAETRSLFAIRTLALPEPLQQFEIRDQHGRIIGASDFAWESEGVLGEYDGEGKYCELARPGESPADVVRREKRRQEAMETEGWVFARWGKEELARPHLLRDRILAAFRIAAGRGTMLRAG
ncbi:type IV toxin-antitoxin system AbiEi family antitoxin domain-containing protein [Aestuariimicrobium kwangyangense]|uniref:type IV toxin-antitoxin system AbiEi family antitoxin domain-containing protein n=1 Tax=Aestuariimicrobium kwangyangense TaxID=396389 RepID=UPI0003B52264|nr:type IV toxin-antitoxin system AbiEi family antitoxin domain-containing protein [Aestuariimicrobium kwangyangense]